jgi:hypothetical protein
MEKRTHCLLYNPVVPVQQLTPLADLESILSDANNRVNSNQLAKMVRLNWMVENLKTEPVYKPLLVDHNMVVQTGDTRVAAIQLSNTVSHVAVLMSTPVEHMNLDWIYVQDNDHLGDLLDIDPKHIMTHDDWHFNAIDWIEFGYAHTADHMHDEEERYRMITRYLDQYPDTVFTRKWLQTPVNWLDYAVNR